MHSPFRGTYTALVTPFTENDEIDFAALESLLQDQIAAGIEGVVLLGTTGESPTIREAERTEIVRFGVQSAKGKMRIIVGTGTNATSESIRHSREAEELGADGLLVVNPYYNKPTQEGLYEHFSSIAGAVSLPIIVYNIQGRTGGNVETSTLMRLAALPNIVAVKEASGNIGQMMEVLRSVPSHFSVLSGDDNLTFPLITLGGHGVISVLSNIVPKEVKAMVDAALKGDYPEARRRHYDLLPVMKGCFLETNPLPVKTALAEKGVVREHFRLPMCQMGSGKKAEWLSILHEAGIFSSVT